MKSFFVITAMLLLFACKEKTETIQPKRQNITESVYASGIVKSGDQYQVFANTSGLISKLNVTEGEQVYKGQTIAMLSNKALRLNAESSKIAADFNAFENNRARLEEMRQNIDLARQKKENDALMAVRQRNMWQQGLGTHVELEQRELAAKNSATTYENAQLQYEQLRKQLNYAAQQSRANASAGAAQVSDLAVKSDVTGKVFTIMKKQGEMVTPQTPIAIIGDSRAFYLELQVDEYDIAKIEPGQKIMVSMDSYKGQAFEAVVSKIIPYMNDRSKSFTVQATFTDPPPKLYPNLTVEANIIIQVKNNVLLIPRAYLVDNTFVILKNGEKRKVVTGVKDYQQVEIISGLKQEDIISKPK